MPNRRFLPHTEALEVRALLTTVVLADIDTGAQPIPSWAGYDGDILPATPLGSSLVPGWDFRSPGNPTPSIGMDSGGGYGGHGSLMAARYALAMVQAGQPAVVTPLIAGDQANFTSDAIGRAMLFVAGQQGWDNFYHIFYHIPIRWVVALPVEPGIEGPVEQPGRAALAATDVPLSE